jgi:mRNA-degrading endonuclease toxin of MazEF toxin-antitoxin module
VRFGGGYLAPMVVGNSVQVAVSSLPHDSVVNLSQLITLDKSLLTEKVSRLPAESLREVEAGIRLVLAL